MKENILVDSGIITEYLKTGKGVLPTAYEKYTMFISGATYTELLASKTFVDSGLEKEVLDFVEKYFTIKGVTKEIAYEAARILRKKSITLASSLVAATAVVEKMPLLTTDKGTFTGVDGLALVNL